MSTNATIASAKDVMTVLLQGEISAVETYGEAIKQFGEDHTAAELHRIRDEHREAVESLQSHGCETIKGSADEDGASGVFASGVTNSASTIGPATVLHALRQGENQGVSQYESALAHEEVSRECKEAIRGKLLPRSRSHVLELDHLLAGK